MTWTVLVVVGLLLGVVLSVLFQRGTDAERANSGDWNRVTGRFVNTRYPSRFALIFAVFVVVLLVGSFFIEQ